MEHTIGRVNEIRIGSGRHMEVCIICPESTIPSAGQYLLAYALDDPDAVLSMPLFAVKPNGVFGRLHSSSANWEPGTMLHLLDLSGMGLTYRTTSNVWDWLHWEKRFRVYCPWCK